MKWSRSLMIRFLQKVETHGMDSNKCWPWKGASKNNGYGHVTVKGVSVTAHRRSYELFIGPIPKGMDVCHTCDNRYCVNPDHLFIGSRQENMDDCRKKGRTAGFRRKHLTQLTVQEIRRRAHAGVPASRIAETMGLKYHRVMSVIAGRTYPGKKRKERNIG